jgi:hypothetical protein
MRKRFIPFSSHTGQVTRSPTKGTVIEKIVGLVLAESSTKIPSKAEESATAPPGSRGVASEALFILLLILV